MFLDQYYLVLLIIPAALGLSILRYRLWDIDVLIRRTLAYSLVTLALAAVYSLLVVLLEAVFRWLTGENSIIAIVLSTLAITLLFSPLRLAAQGFIDRRFYRRKYNTAQTLEAFSARLREDIELDHLSAELMGAVDETLQPERISLWLVAKKSGD